MKKLALLVVFSALLAASTANAATPSGPGAPTVILHFFDVTTNSAATFSENQRPKLGDLFYSHDKLYTWRGVKRGALVGHSDTSFVVLGPNLGEVSGVATLPGGTVVVAGQVTFSTSTSTIPVIGG